MVEKNVSMNHFVISELVDGLEAHNITQVACGAQHTLAQNEWGEMFAWGSNSSGQLGLNVEESIMPTPKMVKSLATKQVVQIACGRSHSMALTNGKRKQIDLKHFTTVLHLILSYTTDLFM